MLDIRKENCYEQIPFVPPLHAVARGNTYPTLLIKLNKTTPYSVLD